MSIRVAIVEDTPEIAANLERVLQSDIDFSCVANFANAEIALRMLPQKEADLCILDIGLPGMSGLDALARMRESLPQMKIVIFTVFEDSEHILEAIRLGANGYLLKDTDSILLRSELKVVMLGGATLTQRVAVKIGQLLGTDKVAPIADEENENVETDLLTARQVEILNYIALGFDYKEIADEMNISAHTVRRHIEHIYQRLRVNNKREAIRAGFKFGFLKNLTKWL
jgi:DNA-binding NarL/FixJ family response regulator